MEDSWEPPASWDIPVQELSSGARLALLLAWNEARRFGHDVGTEEILLGLVHATEEVAARVLSNLGIDLNRIPPAMKVVFEQVGYQQPKIWQRLFRKQELGITSRAKTVVGLAADEARKMGHTHVDTGHLLLGLLGEGESVPAGLLKELGITLDRARPETHRVLGDELSKQERWAEAVVEYEKAIELDPTHAAAYNDAGVAYNKLGQNGKAIERWNEALRANPNPLNLAVVHHNRGIAYKDLGQPEKAIKDYDEAIQINPNYAFAFNSRGHAYYDLGQYEIAIQDFGEAIRLNPSFWYPYVFRAMSLARLGKDAEAERDVNWLASHGVSTAGLLQDIEGIRAQRNQG